MEPAATDGPVPSGLPLHAEPRRFTRVEYDRLVEMGFFQRERLELIHGILVRMSPIGPRHMSVVRRLTELLVPPLLGRAQVRIQGPLLAAGESEPEPDVAVVPPGDDAQAHPHLALLVIEVADSSLEYDRKTKGPLYAASGIPEYWIINLVERVIEVHRQPGPGGFASVHRVGPGESLAPAAFGELLIDVSQLLP